MVALESCTTGCWIAEYRTRRFSEGQRGTPLSDYLGDWIDENKPVQVIGAIVDELDGDGLLRRGTLEASGLPLVLKRYG